MNKLAVDLNTNTNNNLGRIKKCDSTELEIILKNGQDYSKCSFRLLGIKADGKRVEQLDNYKLLENKLTFNLNREFTTCEGIVKLELNVFKDHEEITTQTFYFLVSNTLNSEIITSSEDIKTLRDLEHYILVANNALQDTNKTINTLQDTSNKIIPVENERIENEAARKQDEKFRTAAEKDRIAAEKVRAKSEDDRNNTEEERQLNENTRQSNELKRKTAENLRVKREDAREAAEILRQDLFEENEGIRNESENTRIKNENKRILSENIRIENENNRILQEEDRQKKEDIRIENEDLRAAAEKIREQQETNRENHYNDFNNAESDRVKAEQIREQKETERMSGESKRNELYNEAEKKRDLSFEEAERNRTRIYNVAEDERTENEKNRIIAESKRNSKEDIRINAEKLRVEAESKREQQEANRNNTFEESQRNREELYKVAENKREKAESARVEAEKIREQQESERIEAEKIREEKIEQFGSQVTKNKNDIKENSKDIERAFETINDNSFIPFTGEDISVEHSKVGFTKDMQIEGMTYQNLCKSKIITVPEGQVYSDVISEVNLLKCGKTYTVIYNITKSASESERCTPYFNDKSGNRVYQNTQPNYNTTTGVKKWVVTFEPDFIPTHFCWWVQKHNADFEIKDFIILEGDYSNKYIPNYFEGIKSVGKKENKISVLSNGKNLFKMKNSFLLGNNKGFSVAFDENTQEFIFNGTLNSESGYLGLALSTTNFFKVKKGAKYTLSVDKQLPFALQLSERNVKSILTLRPSNTFINKFDDTTVDYSLNNINYIMIWGIPAGYKFNDFRFKMQIEENIKATPFEPYKENKKEILLPYEDGLKGILNGDKDNIVIKKDGIYIVQKIYKKIFDGTHSSEWNCWVVEDKGNNWKFGAYNLGSHKPKSNSKLAICDKFVVNSIVDESKYTGVTMYAHAPDKVEIRFSISKEKLVAKGEMLTNEEINEWFKNNPTTFYYQLAESIEYKITDLNSINLETFKDITYVSSENEIKPNLSFKAPVDIPATISTLKAANTMLIAQNVGLENKNKQLEKVNNKQTEKINQLDEATTALISSALM